MKFASNDAKSKFNGKEIGIATRELHISCLLLHLVYRATSCRGLGALVLQVKSKRSSANLHVDRIVEMQ
jgi:hypothetical protein